MATNIRKNKKCNTIHTQQKYSGKNLANVYRNHM